MPRPWPWEAAMGCRRPCAEPIDYIDGEPITQCPSLLVQHWTQDFIWCFPLFRRGVMPDAGGFLDQSAAWIDAMYIIQAARNDEQERQRELADARAQRDSKGASGGGAYRYS